MVTTATTGDLVRVPSSVSRLRYFFGQLLTQRDLQAEQTYHLLLQRLSQRETFGTGTVAGLRVEKLTSPSQALFVNIRPGLAMDPDGRELILNTLACVQAAEHALAVGTPVPTITSDDPAVIASDLATFWGEAIDSGNITSIYDALKRAGFTEVDGDVPTIPPPGGTFPGTRDLLVLVDKPVDFALPVGVPLWQYLVDRLVGITYIGLRYNEVGADPAPAVLDGSCCGTSNCFPTRADEGVVIVGRSTPFPAIPDPYEAAKEALIECFTADETVEPPPSLPVQHDCETCLSEYLTDPATWRGLPPLDQPCAAGPLPEVPIACVYWNRIVRSASPTEGVMAIDNVGCRPLAPGVPAVRALLEAVTMCKSPAFHTPSVIMFSPPDHSEFVFGSGEAKLMADTGMKLAIDGALSADTWSMKYYASGATAVDEWDAISLPPPFTVDVSIATVGEKTLIQAAFGETGFPRGTFEFTLNAARTAGTHAIVTVGTAIPLPQTTYTFRY